MPRVLLLTVGTGDMNDRENSLLAPLRLSIADGEWERVVLLPSTVTQEFAMELNAERGFEVRVLPAPGLENDADACFRHFEGEIERLRDAGFVQADIVVDFTRGTKAMSAALVLAAIAHDLPRLRYITGERDSRGMVMAGTEKVHQTSPATALALRRIDMARGLVAGGAFAAALDLLPDPDNAFAALQTATPRKALLAMRSLARFLAAWDRLDYAAAATETLPPAHDLPAGWRALRPDQDLVGWVWRLHRRPDETDMPGMAAWLRPLAIDLLANAERRVRQHQFEDALVRSYRVLELVGQARLFDHGMSSDAVPEDHPKVKKLRRDLEKSRSNDFNRNPKGGLYASRILTARLLGRLDDPLGKPLQFFDSEHGAFAAESRNTSVLIHGFDTKASNRPDQWATLFAALWSLLEQDRATEPDVIADSRRTTTFPPVGMAPATI